MKTHLKRIAAPKTWPIQRKGGTFITRPRPKGQPLEWTLPVSVVLRDVLGIVRTTKDAIKAMRLRNITVNGKRVYKADAAVGFMDVLCIEKDMYRISLNKKNQIAVEPTKSDLSLLKITGKTSLKKGKIQLNTLSGANIIVEKDTFKTGDTITVKDGKVKDHLKFENGATVFITGGAHIGSTGTIENIDGTLITIKADKITFTTTKAYAYVVTK